MPAIATQTRSPHQTTSHGLDSCSVVDPGAAYHWVPSPASVRTSPVERVMPRKAWLTVSATTTS